MSQSADRRRLLSASATMAAGTVVSRVTGFARSALLLAVLGKSLDADLFATANTVPNSLYILVAGGVFNVVLVPQLVRSMRSDADGGEAFAQRLLSLGVLILAGATAVFMASVPLLAHVIFSGELFGPDLTAQRQSAYALMWWCMPQVFGYGVFVLVGQVLNARERFGPMMWAPIVNNVVACAMLGAYAAAWGTSDDSDGFSAGQEAVLGGGATLGIALQALVLVPYARAAGFRFRLRMDLRGVGMGRTLRLGAWTLAFVIANQVSFVVVTRLATSSSTQAALEGTPANGVAVYQAAFLVSQVPHAIITVSLVTATMPLLSRLAADGDTVRLRGEMVDTLRLVLVAIAPVATALACLGPGLAVALFSYGALDGGTAPVGWTMVAFAPGLVFFTVHYLVLRGFYAQEDTRTPFLVQLVVSGTNILAAVGLTLGAPTGEVATRLALAYGGAYLLGSLTSIVVLSRRVGGLVDRDLMSFGGRLVAACTAAASVMLVTVWLLDLAGLSTASSGAGFADVAVVLTVSAATGILAYLLAARVGRLDEVRALFASVFRR